MNLYIVSTPIGNLEDITLRAVNVLSNVDLILAEDTRVTKNLLERYNIKTEMMSYHQYSGPGKIKEIVELLKKGKNLALVSDAGTPGINDPGSFLISQVLKEIPDLPAGPPAGRAGGQGLKIVPIPGPNAAIAALSISGFPTDNFVYLGFPPHKKGRRTFFRKIGEIKETIVFYESKHKILKALENLKEISKISDRKIMIARELTKQFETIYRGTVEEVQLKLNKNNLLGEFVVVIEERR